MNTPSESGNGTPPRRSLFSRMTLIAFVAGAALAGSIVAVAATGMGACGFHHGMMSGPHSAADVSAHVDHVLKHLYVEIDATDAQKAQITPLVQQAVNDLLPMHAQLQAAHAQAIQALTRKHRRSDCTGSCTRRSSAAGRPGLQAIDAASGRCR